MRCPLDDAPMREVTRRGVKVDICPECRGVWLDRGELDHLIDADPGFDDPVQPTSVSRGREDVRDPRFGESRSRRDTSDDDRGFFSGGRSRRDTSDDDRSRSSGGGGRRRKRSWLSEMFEFGE